MRLSNISKIVLVFVIGCFLLTGCSNSASNKNETKPASPAKTFTLAVEPGELVVLSRDCFGAKLYSDFELLNQYAATSNVDATHKMMLQGRIIQLDKDLVAEIVDTRHIGHVQIQMKNGYQKGIQFYVVREAIEKGERANKIIQEYKNFVNTISQKNDSLERVDAYLAKCKFEFYPGTTSKTGKTTKWRSLMNPNIDQCVNIEYVYTGANVEHYYVSTLLGRKVNLSNKNLAYMYGFYREAFGDAFASELKSFINESLGSLDNKPLAQDVKGLKKKIANQTVSVSLYDCPDGILLDIFTK